MKRLTFVIMLSLLGTMLLGAPHSFLPMTVEQPDGSQIEIFASGDEFHNWLHDKDNYTIVKDDGGWYVYAAKDKEGVMPTELKAGLDKPAQRSLNPGINLSPRLIAERYERMSSMRDYSNGRSPNTGQFNNLVVFIRFSDDPDFAQGLSYYDNMFNNSSANANSMKNYFTAASYNQLTVDSFYYPEAVGDQIVSYIDSHPRNYYRKQTASNPIGYDEDDFWERTNREHTLLANAIDYVADMIPMSLDLDMDDDGYVDNVCFIIQGATDGWAELLWPHRWVLYAADAFIHGAQVWDFNFQLESSLNYSGASVLAHEMFHSLGAPDLYRYNDNTITPIGNWDLMSGNTNPPQHMSAWMKYRYGQWLTDPPWITESGSYTLHPVASSSTNNIYRIASWRSGESFVLEYRKAHQLYDSTLPGEGLLVYRLNPQINGNADGPPDELYIYRPGANNTTTNGSLSQAAFSQQNLRTMMTENTVPSGFSGINTSGGLYLYNIGFVGETISFDVRITDVQLRSPIGGETWFSGTNKQIQWISKNGLGTVKLEYSTDLGDNWILIADQVQNSGSYTWMNIPVIDSEFCLVRITLNSNNHWDSSLHPFNVISSMAIPELVYPADMQEDVPTNPLFSWEEVPGADSYYFRLSRDLEFEDVVINLVDHPDAFYQSSGLEPFSIYYWQVASVGEVGISFYSNPVQFITGPLSEAPEVPSLMSPPNYATNQARNPEMHWSSSFLAETYRLQIAPNAFFSNPVVDLENLTQTRVDAPILEPNTNYYWRVSAQNSYASSSFTSARRFSTGDWVDNDDELAAPAQNLLEQNYPNPFNPSTTISFQVKDPGLPASLTIYNSKGQAVRKLFSGIPGRSQISVSWDGRDSSGEPVGSGIYLYRMRSGSETLNRKMVLSK